MGLREEVIRAFEVPPIMQPYVDLVADELEMKLVVALGDQAVTADEPPGSLPPGRRPESGFPRSVLPIPTAPMQPSRVWGIQG